MGRKIILNLAMSLDGYIADENNGFDWIQGDGNRALNSEKLFNFDEFMEGVDTVVMGRKSFDICGVDNLVKGSKRRIIVATSEKRENITPVEFISENLTDYIRELRSQKGKHIWLFGGSGLTDRFIKEDLVDEYIVGIVPILLGGGTLLFKENNPRLKLRLTEFTVQEGLVILKYVKR